MYKLLGNRLQFTGTYPRHYTKLLTEGLRTMSIDAEIQLLGNDEYKITGERLKALLEGERTLSSLLAGDISIEEI